MKSPLVISISLVFSISSLFAFAQTENLVKKGDSWLYKNELYNQTDRYGKLLGKGLTVLSESAASGQVQHRVVGRGVYMSGLKEGTWIYSNTGNLEFPEAEVHYFNDRISRIVFYHPNSTNIWLKAEPKDGEWKYYAWDSNTKHYTSTSQDIQTLIATYNIQ